MSMQEDLETLIWFGQKAGRSVEEIAAGIIRIGWRPPASEAEPDARLAEHDREAAAKALREAADAMDADPGFRDPLRLHSDWLRTLSGKSEAKQ